jgi:hypothetical protein
MQRYEDIDGELVMSDEPPLIIHEDQCVLLSSQEYDYHQVTHLSRYNRFHLNFISKTYNRRDGLCVSLHLYTPPYLDCHFPNKKCTGTSDTQSNSWDIFFLENKFFFILILGIPVAYCGNLEEARAEEQAACNAIQGFEIKDKTQFIFELCCHRKSPTWTSLHFI